MRTLNLFLIFFFLFSFNSYSLPKCEGGNPLKWDNCYGVHYNSWGVYEGEWRNGKRDGKGAFWWIGGTLDGIKFKGEYKDDRKHGMGTLTFADGEKWVGEWNNGEFVE